jgi:hypothetical protein
MRGSGVPGLRERNQRILRVLLAVMAALVTGSFLVGIRW